MILDGKICLIVGASSGMGQKTALEAGAQGATVIVAARREALCQAAVEQIQSKGGQASALLIDGTDQASIEAGLKTLEARYVNGAVLPIDDGRTVG